MTVFDLIQCLTRQTFVELLTMNKKYFEAARDHDVRRRASHPCYLACLAFASQIPSLCSPVSKPEDHVMHMHQHVTMCVHDAPSFFLWGLCRALCILCSCAVQHQHLRRCTQCRTSPLHLGVRCPQEEGKTTFSLKFELLPQCIACTVTLGTIVSMESKHCTCQLDMAGFETGSWGQLVHGVAKIWRHKGTGQEKTGWHQSSLFLSWLLYASKFLSDMARPGEGPFKDQIICR